MGIEAVVTPRAATRVRASARRGTPVLIAALALLGTAAAWPAGGEAAAPQGAARTQGHAALLASSARVMLPGPEPSSSAAPRVSRLRKLLKADVLVVSRHSLRPGTDSAVRAVRGVAAARPVDAARIQVNGKYIAVLGVDPSSFRAYAARPTAASASLWQNVADGGIAVSYTMGRQDKLPLGGTVRVTGRSVRNVRVAGFGTVGIGGVDAVVSHTVALSLGFPSGNAIVVSAPHARITSLVARIKHVTPKGTLVEPLVASTSGNGGAAGALASSAGTSASGTGLTGGEIDAFLKAAISRRGMPYIWGAAGPASFDCSGLVQWSFAQAGVVMPRVAADQARTGPAVPVSQLQPGDLLFYHTDPTAPDYISHVAIFLGNGWMIQAPEPGENVQIVPLTLGSEFAGAVRVSPAIAASVAASPVG